MATKGWSQIETLFLEAIDLPLRTRQQFLDTACAGNAELRAELDSLLAMDYGGGDDDIAQALAQEAALLLKPPVLEGQRLGVYRVLREIGRGGMGAVYLAERDDNQYRQQVAIKVVKPGMDTAEVLRRFHHERQILAGLEHPYIARLLDGGCTSDGRPFLVMEMVEGQPIDSFCRERGLGAEERCRLFLKVCEAVSYAHRKLVVHRDLKPGNTLISGADPGCPKLLDFGLAKLLAPQGEGGLTATAAMRRPLTPDYASPEQIRGGALTTATDIYSLGVILHELLTGARPRPGVRKLHGDLDNILTMALREDADRRYASVDDFASDIRRYLEIRPVLARPDALSYRASKFVRRHRLPLLAGGVALAGLVCGTAIAVVQAHQAQVARRVAETRQRDAQAARRMAETEHTAAERERDAAIAEQRLAEDRLTQMLTLSERSLSDVYTQMERLPGAGPARRELILTTLDFLERLSKDAGANARLRVALAKAYLRLGDLQLDASVGFESALKSYQAGTALLEGPFWAHSAEQEHRLVWFALERQLAALFTRTDTARAVAGLRAAVEVWNRLPASFRAEREFVHARAGMYHALAAASHHDLRLTRGYANQYLAVITTLAERDPADPDLRYELSLAHIELGWTLWALGDPVATAGHYRKAIELREQLVKERPADMVYRRSLMLAYEHFAAVEGGGSVNSLGKPDIARTYYEKAMPLAETAAADTANKLASEDYALLILRSAAVDAPAERIPASLASLRRSAAMFESLRRASNDRTKYAAYLATAHEFIGNRQLDSGGYPEAIASYEHAQALAAGVPASDITHREASRSAFECEIGIARAMALAGNRSGALAHSAMSIRMAGRSAPTDADQSILKSPDAQAYLALADVYRTFEEWVPAREAAERALASASPLPAGNAWSPNAGIFHEAEALIAECVSRSDTR